jgi:hypothetical protein
MKLEDAKRQKMSLHPGLDGQRPSQASMISTCCYQDDDEPGCWEAHGTKKLWKETKHFPIAPVRGNVVAETEEASGECLREARRTVLGVLNVIPRLAK